MLLIRRLWVGPAFFCGLLFYFFFLRQRGDELEPYYGNVHWEKKPERYPLDLYAALPIGGKPIPRIQFDPAALPELDTERTIREERKYKVKDAFVHAWAGYKKYAFRRDEVMPLSGSFVNSFGGWGATMVDAMDTLWIMGLKEDFELCVDAVMSIDFTSECSQLGDQGHDHGWHLSTLCETCHVCSA
jgi:hypothetical protein